MPIPTRERLNWSLIRVVRSRSRTARVGIGAGLLRAAVFVTYCHTTRSAASTSTMRLLLESVSSVWPSGSRLANGRRSSQSRPPFARRASARWLAVTR
jgi:hypothetical protein